jgi:hypothetical protein
MLQRTDFRHIVDPQQTGLPPLLCPPSFLAREGHWGHRVPPPNLHREPVGSTPPTPTSMQKSTGTPPPWCPLWWPARWSHLAIMDPIWTSDDISEDTGPQSSDHRELNSVPCASCTTPSPAPSQDPCRPRGSHGTPPATPKGPTARHDSTRHPGPG